MPPQQISKEKKEKLEAMLKLRNTAWQDLIDSQKIERMREEVKNINQFCRRQIDESFRKVRILQEHSHQDNKIVVPLEEQIHGAGACVPRGRITPEGKEYF